MKKYLIELFTKAAKKLNYLSEIDYSFDTPKSDAHGDYSCNAAMMLSKRLKKNPKLIAEEIISNLDYDEKVVEKIEIAGPGFINMFFTPDYKTQMINHSLSK